MTESLKENISQELEKESFSKTALGASCRKQRMQLDSKRCWLVAGCSSLIHFLVYGFAYSIGVFYDEFLEVFREGKGTTAWISSLNYGFLCATGPIGSILIDKFGCRVAISIGAIISSISLVVSSFATSVFFLLVSLGIFTGLGFGISYMGAVVVISMFFSKYRAIAMGIAASGSAIGTFIFPLLKRFLLSKFSWEGTLLICAALHLHTIAAAMLIPSKSPIDTKKDKPSSKPGWKEEGLSFIKNKGFILLCLNNFMFCLGLFVVYTHMASYARSLGQTKFFASLLISLTGAASLLGRLGLSGTIQLKLLSAPTVYALSFLISGLGTIISGFWTSQAGIIITTISFGFFSSSYGCVSPEVACYIVGVEDLNRAYGIQMLASSVGIILGAPIAGFIYDHTNIYPASFYFGGVCMCLGSVMLAPVFMRCWKFEHTDKSEIIGLSAEILENGDIHGCKPPAMSGVSVGGAGRGFTPSLFGHSMGVIWEKILRISLNIISRSLQPNLPHHFKMKLIPLLAINWNRKLEYSAKDNSKKDRGTGSCPEKLKMEMEYKLSAL